MAADSAPAARVKPNVPVRLARGVVHARPNRQPEPPGPEPRPRRRRGGPGLCARVPMAAMERLRGDGPPRTRAAERVPDLRLRRGRRGAPLAARGLRVDRRLPRRDVDAQADARLVLLLRRRHRVGQGRGVFAHPGSAAVRHAPRGAPRVQGVLPRVARAAPPVHEPAAVRRVQRELLRYAVHDRDSVVYHEVARALQRLVLHGVRLVVRELALPHPLRDAPPLGPAVLQARVRDGGGPPRAPQALRLQLRAPVPVLGPGARHVP
mmetsp:Transcript_18443/g.56773  ORF Transcript_18443/g.56773 Transcript_18443/m.56773 type:complete len:265 (+) Transcript_18443:383-1177(+)